MCSTRTIPRTRVTIMLHVVVFRTLSWVSSPAHAFFRLITSRTFRSSAYLFSTKGKISNARLLDFRAVPLSTPTQTHTPQVNGDVNSLSDLLPQLASRTYHDRPHSSGALGLTSWGPDPNKFVDQVLCGIVSRPSQLPPQRTCFNLASCPRHQASFMASM